MAITVTLSAEFSTGVWTSIMADVLADVGIEVQQGISGNGPLDRVSSTGTMRFSLDNSAFNSGGLQGYYTPGHTNCRSGFEEGLAVRLYFTNGTYTKYVFYGHLTDILPQPGKFAGQRTDVVACDYMNTLAEEDVSGLAVLTDVTGNQVLTAVVTEMTRAPLHTAYQTGPDIFPYAGHSENAQRTSGLAVCQKIAQSDLGWIGVDGSNVTYGAEWLFYKNRHKRYTLTSAATLTESEISEMVVSRSRDQVYNSISVTTYPVRVDDSAVVLADLQQEMEIVPGETIEVKLRYRDPDQPALRVSAINVIEPVAGTDFHMSSHSGGGSDLNDYLDITTDDGANEATLTLENIGVKAGFINTLQIRGQGIYFDDPVTVTEESGDGDRPLTVNMPYQSSPQMGQSLAARLLAKYESVRTRVDSVTFVANTATLEGYAINVNIHNRVTVSESVSGISGDYFTTHITHKIKPLGVVTVTWRLDDEPGVDNYWLLGDATHSILGSTTYLVI